MKKFFLVSVFFVTVVQTTKLFADSVEISLNKALEIAAQNNLNIRIARKELREKEQQIKQNWSTLFPHLTSQASLLRQDAENGFQSLSDGQYDLRFVQLQLQINPGEFLHKLQAARDSYELSRQKLRQAEQDLEFQVIKAYFDVLLAEDQITSRRRSIKLYEENLQEVQKMYDAGSVPKFELLQAQVQLSSQRTLLTANLTQEKQSLDLFNFLLGKKGKSRVKPKSLQPGKAVTVAMPNKQEEQVITTLHQAALKKRPELNQLDFSARILKRERQSLGSSRIWPTFSVQGSYGKSYLLPNALNLEIIPGVSPDLSALTGRKEWQNTWQFQMAATYRWGGLIPLDQVAQGRKVLRSKEEQVKLQQKNLRDQIHINLSYHYNTLITAYQNIHSQTENVRTAEEGLRIAQESYAAGIIKNSELLNAELALSQARNALIQAVHNYYVSIAALSKETGDKALVKNVLFPKNGKQRRKKS